LPLLGRRFGLMLLAALPARYRRGFCATTSIAFLSLAVGASPPRARMCDARKTGCQPF
jgi:hypothetical protein